MAIIPPCDSSEISEKLLRSVSGKMKDEVRIKEKKHQIKGSVILMKPKATGLGAFLLDQFDQLLGGDISFQLMNDPQLGPAKQGKEAYLENWVLNDEASYDIAFDWDESLGFPGAFAIRNYHHHPLYLKILTLEDVPGHGPVHFVCHSWVDPLHRDDSAPVFLQNKHTSFRLRGPVEITSYEMVLRFMVNRHMYKLTKINHDKIFIY